MLSDPFAFFMFSRLRSMLPCAEIFLKQLEGSAGVNTEISTSLYRLCKHSIMSYWRTAGSWPERLREGERGAKVTKATSFQNPPFRTLLFRPNPKDERQDRLPEFPPK